MNIEEFQTNCRYLRKIHDELNTYETNQKLLDYCRSVYRENKDTLNDRDLEVVLGEYYDALIFEETPDEWEEVNLQREAVYRRLSATSFRQYGRRWAYALEALVDNRDPSSLEYYEKSIAIYERLKREYNEKNINYTLAESYSSVSSFCDIHEMYEKAIDYNNKALELYVISNCDEFDRLYAMGMCHHKNGEAYLSLGRYVEAKKSLTKAVEIYSQIKTIDKRQRPFDHFGMHIDLCLRFLKSIQRLESLERIASDSSTQSLCDSTKQ